MRDQRCSECGMLFPEDELLLREDDNLPVCPECSGLLAGEDLGCRFDEVG